MESEERFERIERGLLQLIEDSQEFKREMRVFKDEMLAFRQDSERDRIRMNRAWGDLANKLGTILEDIAAPNVSRLAVEQFGFGVVEDVMVRAKRTSRSGPRRQTEFDVVCAGAQKVIYAEMKSNPDEESIRHCAAKLAELLDFFPEYKDRQLIGIYASWSLDEKMRVLIAGAGLYGMAMAAETMEIVVSPDHASP